MTEDAAQPEDEGKPASEPHRPYLYEVRHESRGKETKTYIWWVRPVNDPKDGMRDVLVDPSGRRYGVTKVVKQAEPDYPMGRPGVVLAEIVRDGN